MRWVIRLAVLACAAVFAGTISAAPAGVNATASGDADCDGGVDAADALAVLRDVAGLSSAACIGVADVDCDEDVDTIDALSIMRYVAGLTVNLPDGCLAIGTEAGLLLLNEVLFLPGPGDTAFVELKNAGGGAAVLDAVTLVNESSQTYAVPDGSLAAGALLLVAPGGAFLDSESGFVELRHGGEVLDRVAWGDEADAVNPGPGGVVDGAATGVSVGRAPGALDIDALQWAPYAESSPGEPNPQADAGPALPLDGAIFGPGPVLLRWYPVPGAESYRVRVSASESLDPAVFDQTVAEPAATVTGLVPGVYYWGVLAAGGGGPAVQSFVTSAAGAAAHPLAATGQVTLDVPFLTPHKDTAMLLMESRNETGDFAWDTPHEDVDPDDPADVKSSVLAAVAMVNHYYGGTISQDRLGFEAFKDLSSGPEHDLPYGRAVTREQGRGLMAFALGSLEELCSTDFLAMWNFMKGSIDGGGPVVAITEDHAVVITGYRIADAGGGPAVPERSTFVNDSFIGPYAVDWAKQGFACLWGLAGPAEPRDDEAIITADSDLDGIVDFDEWNRFDTRPDDVDSDADGLQDREEVRQSVFQRQVGYTFNTSFGALAPGRDFDGDHVPMEHDCDSDNDAVKDGEDADNFTDVEVDQPADCLAGIVVDLTWDADIDLDLYVLPQTATSKLDSNDQFGLPGYTFNNQSACLDYPPDQTLRGAVIDRDSHFGGVASESRYIGVYFSAYCPASQGPSGVYFPFTLTVRYMDGSSEHLSGAVEWSDDWRLYGPFDFSGD